MAADVLVITCGEGKSVHIGDDVVGTVVSVRGGQVRLGITAPRQVKILRDELISWVNEVDDSLTTADVTAYAPCQPIGCDNGYHLSNCYYADTSQALADEDDKNTRPEEADQ